MVKRIRWMILGAILLGAATVLVVADFRDTAGRPSELVVELAKAKGYVEAAVSKRPPKVIRETIIEQLPAIEAEPIVYVRFADEFVEPEPPPVMVFPEGEDCPLPDLRPNWTLRPGDLAGICQFTMIRGAPRPLGLVEQTVAAQTPHGVVERILAPEEGEFQFWMAPDAGVRRWQAIFQADVLAPLETDRPVLAVLGLSWFKSGKRRGWNLRAGRGFGGDSDFQVNDVGYWSADRDGND